jgi:hypothetical protein
MAGLKGKTTDERMADFKEKLIQKRAKELEAKYRESLRKKRVKLVKKETLKPTDQ